ncbi:hypothetical protein CH63R_09434 [Colletotrichum higginsianum IMI 349063]|uniref:Mitochondrial export protein Som1 n=1 Tax=Colletotrichum higginsianum (strain IMI 349063) TaxID=759273 RepID=A0A1B7Y769_COLHI|nr:hypothetical protein CH63R_09434 [Colletotrichum higginsianum IMI 349063]OBR07913.1 hypothetical protein CH63R_09434 [Colletotrichum higginsianum IMI 349063]
MAPPCNVFPVSKLELHVQADVKGKKRKLPGGADVDLTKCALKEMTQYRCFIDDPKSRDSPVRCWPIHRLFRQCQDKKGTFTVETTAWEGSSSNTHQSPPTTGGHKLDGGHHDVPSYHEWLRA